MKILSEVKYAVVHSKRQLSIKVKKWKTPETTNYPSKTNKKYSCVKKMPSTTINKKLNN